MTFLGGAQTIGCTCTQIEDGKTKILVDCGGDPSGKTSIHFAPQDLKSYKGIIITHAHYDHYGGIFDLLSGLTTHFTPPIYCTESTKSFMLQFGYKEWLSFGRGSEKITRYKKKQLFRILQQKIIPITYGRMFRIGEFEIMLFPSSHILGSAQVYIRSPFAEGLFTSDFKPSGTFLLREFSPDMLRKTFNFHLKPDFIVIESTYGKERDVLNNKLVESKLVSIISDVFKRGGNLLVPAFAIGRAQEFMSFYYDLFNQYSGITPLNIFFVGATNKTNELYLNAISSKHRDAISFRDDVNRIFNWTKLISVHNFDTYFKLMGVYGNLEQKILYLKEKGFNVFISSGGMMQGPALRLFMELKEDPNNALFLIGYQAKGTSGHALLEAEKSPVKKNLLLHDGKRIITQDAINSENYIKKSIRPLKYRFEIHQFPIFSAHATFSEKIAYINGICQDLEKKVQVFSTHGTEANCIELANYLDMNDKLSGHAPVKDESVKV
ncbi:MAG: MBL fold metallo-hydrolase [Promethearchaeota archaeon]